MTIKELGCCGAYCKTCMTWHSNKYPNTRTCRGCKLGYASGKRDITRAKCRIKVCCFKEWGLETCADCAEYPCQKLEAFWNKKGTKYKQYRNQLEFIRQHGYDEFLTRANTWKGPRGKLEIVRSSETTRT